MFGHNARCKVCQRPNPAYQHKHLIPFVGWALVGTVAERSKALDLGSSLSGGVGSNPTAAIIVSSGVTSGLTPGES